MISLGVRQKLLCHMEQGEVTGYDQVHCIDRIRRANTQKHFPQGDQTSNMAPSVRKNVSNIGKCPVNF